MLNQGTNRPRPRPTRPGLIGNPNRPIGNPNRPIAQNAAAYGPRRQTNNLGYNGQVGPIGPNELIGQGQSFGQGSMDGSGYDGSAGTEEFNGEVNVEVEYEVDVYEDTEDGEANDEGQDVDANGLEIVAYGDDYGAACSESEFGGSSDARSQCNDLPDHADLYPLSVRTNQGSGGGRKKNANPNGPAARSKNMGLNGPRSGLQGSKKPIQSPRGSQTRRVPNVRNNTIGAGETVRFNRPRDPSAFNGPPGINGPNVGPSNAIDNGGNNDIYNNEVEDNAAGYDESYGDDYAAGDGYCDFEAGGDFVDDSYDQAYDETYDENDFESYSDITGGSESMYDGDESYGTVEDSLYGGLNDEPNNQYLPMVGPVGGPGINNQNQYGQTGRPRNMGRYGRGGTTNMNRYGNMNQRSNSAQPRTMGRTTQYRPNGGPNGLNGGPNGSNRNTMMNTMVQDLCQGFAMNMLIGGGGDVNGGAGDDGGSSIIGGLFGGGSEF